MSRGVDVYTRVEELQSALKPLANIAAQYLEDGLDEARPYWVVRGISKYDPEVELYNGRGGRTLITLAHCITAWELLNGKPFPAPKTDERIVRAREVFDSLYVGGQQWEEMSEERQNEYADKVEAMEKKR